MPDSTQIRNRKRLLITLAVAQGAVGLTLGGIGYLLEALNPTLERGLNIMGFAFSICALDTSKEIITGSYAEDIETEETELKEVLVYPASLNS